MTFYVDDAGTWQTEIDWNIVDPAGSVVASGTADNTQFGLGPCTSAPTPFTPVPTSYPTTPPTASPTPTPTHRWLSSASGQNVQAIPTTVSPNDRSIDPSIDPSVDPSIDRPRINFTLYSNNAHFFSWKWRAFRFVFVESEVKVPHFTQNR